MACSRLLIGRRQSPIVRPYNFFTSASVKCRLFEAAPDRRQFSNSRFGSLSMKAVFDKFKIVLTQQNDYGEDNERLQRELAKEYESNECLALKRFEQEQLQIECEKTIGDLINVRTLLRWQIAD
jgi:hypothetical protein